MTPNLGITSEQINDVPLLLGIMSDMGLQELIDAQIKPHGAWQGVSVGTLVVIWLSYMLTEQDHRMVMVRDWVAARQAMVNKLLGIELRATDCTDDRLAQVLSMLGDEQTQRQLEEAMTQKWLRVYALPTSTVRFDSTSVSVYHETDQAESLLQYGHSKEHRPDLLQFKAMLSALDPLGLPLTCQVVSGERADDGLYIPAYDAMIRTLARSDVLVVGDSKMGSLATRAHLVAGGSRYLSAYNPPRSQAQLEQWIDQALQAQANWHILQQSDENTGESHRLAVIHEWERRQSFTDAHGQVWTWRERVLVTRSTAMQAGLIRQRASALQRACERLTQFQQPPKQGRKAYRTRAQLQRQVDAILNTSTLRDLLQVDLEAETLPDGSQRWIVAGFSVHWQAWQHMVARLGWRVYLSNTTAQQYDAAALVAVYRHQVIPERTFSRLKTRHLNIRPLYVRDEQRLVGLTWLLALALRILTLTEHRLRSALEYSHQELSGLNPASPTQTTRHPTTERVLQAFQNITFTRINHQGEIQHHVTPLNATQSHLLSLLHLPHDLYDRLATHLPKPLFHLRE